MLRLRRGETMSLGTRVDGTTAAPGADHARGTTTIGNHDPTSAWGPERLVPCGAARGNAQSALWKLNDLPGPAGIRRIGDDQCMRAVLRRQLRGRNSRRHRKGHRCRHEPRSNHPGFSHELLGHQICQGSLTETSGKRNRAPTGSEATQTKTNLMHDTGTRSRLPRGGASTFNRAQCQHFGRC